MSKINRKFRNFTAGDNKFTAQANLNKKNQRKLSLH